MTAMSAPISVTARDLAMFDSLADVRYLTAPALEWLHFPGWQDRYQRARAAGKKYLPSSLLYDRLRRLEQAGLITRVVRPVRYGFTHQVRDQILLALSPAGAALLAEQTGREPRTILFQPDRPPAPMTLAHAAEIGRCYAALRARVALTAGVAFQDWRSDRITARDHDGIQPDGVFRIVAGATTVLCFLELDRRRPVATWREKIRSYLAYTGSPALRDRYAAETFLLLCVTTDPTFARTLAVATAQIVGQPSNRFLFAPLAQVHPTTIGNAWHRIVGVDPVVLQPHTLLR